MACQDEPRPFHQPHCVETPTAVAPGRCRAQCYLSLSCRALLTALNCSLCLWWLRPESASLRANKRRSVCGQSGEHVLQWACCPPVPAPAAGGLIRSLSLPPDLVLYCEAFLTTYRTFITPEELIKKLQYRYPCPPLPPSQSPLRARGQCSGQLCVSRLGASGQAPLHLIPVLRGPSDVA